MNCALCSPGKTIIVWATRPKLSGGQVFDVESDLIETLNPTVNLSRSTLPRELQEYSFEVITTLRRPTKINSI